MRTDARNDSLSFLHVIFTVASLTLQLNLSSSPAVSVGYGFGLTSALGFSVKRNKHQRPKVN